MYPKVFEYQIKFKSGADKNTEYRKTKSLFVKRIDRKCRLLQVRIEQNSDHIQIKHKTIS